MTDPELARAREQFDAVVPPDAGLGREPSTQRRASVSVARRIWIRATYWRHRIDAEIATQEAQEADRG